MDITRSGISFNIDYTGYFNGKPCKVIEGYDIVLSFGKMTTGEMVESEDFQMLQKAGFDVHRDWRDSYLRSVK